MDHSLAGLCPVPLGTGGLRFCTSVSPDDLGLLQNLSNKTGNRTSEKNRSTQPTSSPWLWFKHFLEPSRVKDTWRVWKEIPGFSTPCSQQHTLWLCGESRQASQYVCKVAIVGDVMILIIFLCKRKTCWDIVNNGRHYLVCGRSGSEAVSVWKHQ